jgi:hypothetical protein
VEEVENDEEGQHDEEEEDEDVEEQEEENNEEEEGESDVEDAGGRAEKRDNANKAPRLSAASATMLQEKSHPYSLVVLNSSQSELLSDVD